ncbi:MAG: peptidylprolyl isomerase [Pseudomonadota bacterium]|nr:peptidylprolyl isomerase [Pseudomonadota bacterium]
MLTLFRSFAKSPFALVIILLIVLAFAFTGVGGIFTGSGTAVVVAGNQQVSVRQVAQAFERELQRVQTENPEITREQALEFGLGEQVLQRLTTFAALEAKASELGLAISPDALVDEAARQTAFRNPVTDRFDYNTMISVLQNNGMTEAQFRSELEGDLLRQQLIFALAGSVPAPEFLAETRYEVRRERRQITALLLDASTADEIEDPTEEQLESFIASNQDMTDRNGLPLFTAPEFRAITLVRFRLADFLRDIEIDETMLRETYDYQVETGQLGTPARRSFVQLTAADETTAQTVASRLESGETAAAIAADMGLGEPVELEEVEAYEVPDSQVAEAVFGMSEGAAAAVEGRFGWNAVLVTMSEDAQLPTFEEQLPQLREDAARADALDALYDQIAAFEEARASGATLEQAAAQSGTPIEVYAPLDRYGRDQSLAIDMQRYTELGPDILATAFEQSQGFAIDLEQYNETDYFTVRVDEIIPSAPRALDDVRDVAEARWREIQVDTQLSARADEALEQLQAGEPLDVVALTTGGRTESTTTTRSATAPNFGRNVVSRAFSLDPGVWDSVQTGTGSYALVRVDEIIPADTSTISESEMATMQEELANEMGEDVLIALQQALQQEYGLNDGAVDRQLFARALGQDQTTQP